MSKIANSIFPKKIKIKINYHFICVLFIFAISSLAILWFEGEYFVVGGDYLPILKPINEFNQDVFSWVSANGDGLGQYTGSLAQIFPYELLTALGSVIGFSSIFLQKILFYFLLSFSGLSMYLLIYYSFEKIKKRELTAIFSALFYMFNTYTMFFKWPDRVQSLFGYAFFPLAMIFYIKGMEKEKNFLYLIGIATTFLFMAPAVTTPTYLVIIGLVLFFYYLFYNFLDFDLGKLKKSTSFSLKLIFLLALFNLWWLLPYIYNIFFTSLGVDSFQSAKSLESFKNTLGINSLNTSFLNIFRVMGYWALGAKYNNDYYYPLLSSVYASVMFIWISFFVPIIVFSASLIKKIDRKTRKLILFFIFLSIASLFFIKGVHEPFGKINEWIFFNIPGFSAFRSQYEKLGVILVLSYSVLFGFAISYVYSFLKDRGWIILNKIFVAAMFIIFFAINMFPFWTGQNIQGQRGCLVSQRVSIPVYYNDAYNWINDSLLDKKLSIFPLSKNDIGSLNFQWIGTSGNTLSKLLSLPVNTKLFFSQSDEINNNLDLFVKYLPLINVKYIITDDSQVYDLPDRENVKEIDQAAQGEFIKFIKYFGQLKFYKINPDNYLAHFYTPKVVVTTPQGEDALLEIISQPNYGIRSAIYFNNQKDISDILFGDRSVLYNSSGAAKENIDNLPTIEFKKINPTKYKVIIHHAKENFPLVFSESFHDGWKAYLVKNNLDSLPTGRQAAVHGNDVRASLADYKILDGNADDQATVEEVKSFIDQGDVSTLGNLQEKNIKHDKWVNNKEVLDYNEKYKIDFISKNFQGTIQNDNLPNGNFLDTWLSTSYKVESGKLSSFLEWNKNVIKLPEVDHVMANGYANSWLIEPGKICGTTPSPSLKRRGSYCVKNADGSYDFEMIVEFWPQRLFYIGLAISVLTLLGCVIFIVCDFRNKKVARNL
jgi:hypothetical protein